VCCAADGTLPFADGFFAAAFCSDAFHYFVNKAATARELKRLTKQDGLIILVWVHNVLWRRPHDGLPLSPEAYQRLLADVPHRLLADNDVLARYLRKHGPSLTDSAGMDDLAREPLLSIVASHRQEVFRDYGSFENWPHGEGQLTLNPLYRVEKRGDSLKDVRLRRNFPSDFYTDDHAQSKEYLPETIEVPSQVLLDLGNGQRTPDVEKLVGQFVALGVPRGYS
jgi:SAM-dependent methyltransferase